MMNELKFLRIIAFIACIVGVSTSSASDRDCDRHFSLDELIVDSESTGLTGLITANREHSAQVLEGEYIYVEISSFDELFEGDSLAAYRAYIDELRATDGASFSYQIPEQRHHFSSLDTIGSEGMGLGLETLPESTSSRFEFSGERIGFNDEEVTQLSILNPDFGLTPQFEGVSTLLEGNIRNDFYLHFYYGGAIQEATEEWLNEHSSFNRSEARLIGTGTAAVIGAAKEIIIDPVIGGHQEVEDFLWTAAGGAVMGLLRGVNDEFNSRQRSGQANTTFTGNGILIHW